MSLRRLAMSSALCALLALTACSGSGDKEGPGSPAGDATIHGSAPADGGDEPTQATGSATEAFETIFHAVGNRDGATVCTFYTGPLRPNVGGSVDQCEERFNNYSPAQIDDLDTYKNIAVTSVQDLGALTCIGPTNLTASDPDAALALLSEFAGHEGDATKPMCMSKLEGHWALTGNRSAG